MKQFWFDIWQTYSAPKSVVTRKMRDIPGEPQLLAYVIFASLLSFLARLPGMIGGHNAVGTDKPLEALVGANLVASVIFAPLFFYAVAGLTRFVSQFLGGQGSWQSARLSLFWPLIALQPIIIIGQFLGVLILPTLITTIYSFASALFFLWLWSVGMQISEWPGTDKNA